MLQPEWFGILTGVLTPTRFHTAMRTIVASLLLVFLTVAPAASQTLLVPDRVFDGETMHEGWAVLVNGETISWAGPAADAPRRNVDRIELDGMTLLPGFIEGHSHVLLHPYNEVSWNDQVLKESRAERSIRAAVHAERTLMAGFTTIRDLGAEGAGYADVGVKTAIRKGVIPGPRMLVAGPAIVATGSYGPKGFHPEVGQPLGANPADGIDDLIRETREQIGNGADFIKVYADYRWGPNGEAMPTFTLDELTLMRDVTETSGRQLVAHAATEEGMRRAILAGVATIEHGDGGTEHVFAMMRDRGVVWYPTLAAVEAISSYGGWRKGEDPDPARIANKKRVFRMAMDLGVKIGMGGDVGVYPHGQNAWEMELMVEYGMSTIDVLRAATSLNADTFRLTDRGRVAEGLLADLVAVEGNPAESMSAARDVRFVMKGGDIVRQDR